MLKLEACLPAFVSLVTFCPGYLLKWASFAVVKIRQQ
jgi:hypothetical protein